MTKILALLSVTILAYPAMQAQVSDSLKRLIPFAKSDTARISLYIYIVEAAEDSTALHYSDSAQQQLNILLSRADDKLKNALNNYLSDAIYYKGIYYANTEQYDSAVHFLNAAMQPALTAKNRKQEALIINDIGICYYYKNDIVKSLDYLKRSLALREELQDEGELRNAYNNMAFIYKEIGLVESALE
jgi:tetratricopeptide (TPR) repeat protein